METHASSDEGFAVAEWVLAVTLLIIPTFILVLSLIQIPARKNLTQVASSAAARAYVQALDQSQADAAARAAAEDAIVAEVGENKRGQVHGSISSSGSIKVEVLTSRYCPGDEVSVRVSMPYPVAINPFDASLSSFPVGTLSTTSTERIDDYIEVANNETGDATYTYSECDE